MNRKRAIAAAILPLTLVGAGLTSCSDSSTSEAGIACAPAGDASKSLKIDGEFGGEITLASDAPVEAAALERSVLIEGDGAEIAMGDTVNAQFTIIDGTTGTVSSSEAAQLTYNETSLSEWALQTIGCSNVGDRVASVVPVDEVVGEGGAETYGFTAGGSLVLVFDFAEVMSTRAEGTAQEAPAGFPKVELAEDGAPTITIPDTDAPTELELATLIKGEGETVQEGDNVTVQYTGVLWSNGEVFDSSWEAGAPVSFSTEGVIAGFKKALVGQTVGSQVIVVVPAADGYGESTATSIEGAQADDVLVFVLDVLGTSRAAG